MYVPIPGYAHLMALVPPDPIVYERVPTQADQATRDRVRDLVIVALETASGRRPLTALSADTYDRAVRIHIRAWVKTHSATPLSAQLLSVHAQANGEFHGSVSLGARRHAFTGSFDNGRLRAFRLM